MERNTSYRPNGVLSVLVAAATLCEAGNIAAIDAGYAVPGSEADDLIYLGRFDETVDNSSGAAGEKRVKVRVNESFLWKNSPTDPVVQADVGKTCYIEDAVTVSKTDNTGARSAAGMITEVTSAGVWVSKPV